MKIRQWFALACGCALIAAATAAAGQAVPASTSVEGLVRAKSSQLDQVYLRPGVDFRRYTQVMLDPATVTFDSLWLANMNLNKIAVLQGTTSADAQRIAGEAGANLRKVFAGTLRHAGSQTLAAPGPGVLPLSASVGARE